MMRKIYGLLFFIPGIAWGQSCEIDTFETLTNQFYDYVHNELPAPGDSHSVDFYSQAHFWDRSNAQATKSMPAEMLKIYEKYQIAYERLDKVRANNTSDKRITEYAVCRQEFFEKEIFSLLVYPLGVNWSSDCSDVIARDPSLALTDEQRRSLRFELGAQNLATCRYESGSADDTSEFLPGADRSVDIEGFVPPVRSLDQWQFDLDKNQSQLQVDTGENESAETSVDVPEGAGKNFLDYWKAVFNWGQRPGTFDSQDAEVRTENLVSGREIQADTAIRRAKWENDRNYWVQRSVASGALLDAYAARFETDEASQPILPTLDELNTSLEASLDAIENVCQRQHAKVFCWWGKNTYPEKKKWSPEQSFN